MKKLLLLLFTALPLFLMGQLTSEDFESYTVGEFDPQWDPNNWTGWFGAMSNTDISDAQAHSGTKSVYISDNPTADDLVALLPVLNSSRWEVSFWQYIPSGSGAYINMQHNYTNTVADWAVEVFFSDETFAQALVRTDGVLYAVNGILHDQWAEIRFLFNFYTEQAEFYYNDELLHSWVLPTNSAGGAGLNQINAINLFASCAGTGCISNAYYDDISVVEIPIADHDVSITSFAQPSNYTIVPTGHVQPFNLEATVLNEGLQAVNGLEVTANVYNSINTLLYSESLGSVSNLGALQTATFNSPPTSFLPDLTDLYTIEYITTINETDAFPDNNNGTTTAAFTVSDSVYARDNSLYNSAINAGVPSFFGQSFELLIEEEVTAIHTSFDGGQMGEIIQGHIFSIDPSTGYPDEWLSSTLEYELDLIGPETHVDLMFFEPEVLPPGNYAFMVEQKAETPLLVSATPNIFTLQTTFFSTDGAAWQFLEEAGANGIFLTMNIRPIFGGISVSTKEPEWAHDLRLAPNPTTGWTTLQIDLQQGIRDLDLVLYSMQGQMVYATTQQNASGSYQLNLDLSHLPTGIYMAKVRIGEDVVSRKINVVR